MVPSFIILFIAVLGFGQAFLLLAISYPFKEDPETNFIGDKFTALKFSYLTMLGDFDAVE